MDASDWAERQAREQAFASRGESPRGAYIDGGVPAPKSAASHVANVTPHGVVFEGGAVYPCSCEIGELHTP